MYDKIVGNAHRHELFYRVGFSIGISTIQYLELLFASSSAFFEDRL